MLLIHSIFQRVKLHKKEISKEGEDAIIHRLHPAPGADAPEPVGAFNKKDRAKIKVSKQKEWQEIPLPKIRESQTMHSLSYGVENLGNTTIRNKKYRRPHRGIPKRKQTRQSGGEDKRQTG